MSIQLCVDEEMNDKSHICCEKTMFELLSSTYLSHVQNNYQLGNTFAGDVRLLHQFIFHIFNFTFKFNNTLARSAA